MPPALEALPPLLARVLGAVRGTLFDTTSAFSLASLACALALAAGVTAARRLRRRRRISLRLLARALRPRAAVFGASGKADLGYFLLNTFVVGLLIGWAFLSQSAVSAWTAQGLAGLLGPHAGHAHGWAAGALATGALFVAYDLAYWLDHWLSHRVSWLWEIHKVHHTAEALSPLTVFRVHPLETLKFYNMLALVTGAADGALAYAMGSGHGRLHLLGADAAWVVFAFTVLHLQHSHVWISFPGRWGRLLMSPAHHQVHHSVEARHHGKNLGNALALWDWLAGSLYVPPVRREAFRFGVEGAGAQAHTVTGALVTPMVEAGRALGRDLARALPPRPPRLEPVDIAPPVA